MSELAAPVLPTFDMDTSTSSFANDDEVQAQITKESIGKKFKQGHHELKIIGARYNKKCTDSAWMSICITLGTGVEGDERETKIYPLIPLTQEIKYQKPGGKPTMFCWSQTVNFLNGIGVSSKFSDLSKFQKKFLAGEDCTKPITYQGFSEEEDSYVDMPGFSYHKLVGKPIEVELGYEGYYISRIDDSDDFAVYLKGKVVTMVRKNGDKVELIGDSYNECLMHCTDFDIEDKLTRLEVRKIYAGKPQEDNSDLANL